MNQRLELQNIIQIKIDIAGRVTQSDIIGAVFGQTEQVLVESLDLRKLQKEGKLGRIEVETEYNDKGTTGIITIPSSMDATNTVIIAASMETIEKIGPCKAKATVDDIINIKEIKIQEIVAHAQEVLKKFMDVSIDSQELIDDVNEFVRISQATVYGEEEVVCGPKIESYDEVFFMESKEELYNMLKNGIKNVVAFEDLSKSKTLSNISKEKEIIAVVDKGKEYLVKRLLEFADIDSFSTPEGYDKIRNMGSKELHKMIRGHVSTEQLIGENNQNITRRDNRNKHNTRDNRYQKKENNYVHKDKNDNTNRVRPQPSSPSADYKRDSGRGNYREGGRDNQRDSGRGNYREGGRDNQRDSGRGNYREGGRDNQRDGGRGNYREGGRDNQRDGGRGNYREGGRDNQKREFTPLQVPETVYKLLKEKKKSLGAGESLVLDKDFNPLGKLPSSELASTIGSLTGVKAIVVNGDIDNNLVYLSERNNIEFLCGDKSERTSRRVGLVLN